MAGPAFMCAGALRPTSPRPTSPRHTTAPQCPRRTTPQVTACARTEASDAVSALRRRASDADDAEFSRLVLAAEKAAPRPDAATDVRLTGAWRFVRVSSGRGASPLQKAVLGSDWFPEVTQTVEGCPPERVLTRVDVRDSVGATLTLRAVVERVDGWRLGVRFERGWIDVERAPTWLGGAALPSAVRLPYPVPFALLGDRARAWIDVTVLDECVRVTRGSKGSCFVLEKTAGK